MYHSNHISDGFPPCSSAGIPDNDTNRHNTGGHFSWWPSDVPTSFRPYKLLELLGDDVALCPVADRTKGPRISGWQDVDCRWPELMELWYEEREWFPSVTVLTGAPSGGLCSVDVDSDQDLEEFLKDNPKLASTLVTRGKRGGNVWVRIKGPYPKSSALKTHAAKPWGEWRADGCNTMIVGTHPSGCEYRMVSEVPPTEIAFNDIVWPSDVTTKWKWSHEDAVPEEEYQKDELAEIHGSPILYLVKDDEKHASKFNEGYFAALAMHEHQLTYEPSERRFYRYDAESGLHMEISEAKIVQFVSGKLLEVSKLEPANGPLAWMRNELRLQGVVRQLRGIAEHRDAFADAPRAIHLANCMLIIEDGEFRPVDFSPEFFSRKRSPIAFDPDAECPRFLEELLKPAVETEDIVLLQKMAGLFLLGENLIQKFLLIIGRGGSGKSQFCLVLMAIIGEDNITQLRTEHLGERFELARIQPCSLLVGVDVNADFLRSKGAPVIKGLVGGDMFDAERKGDSGSYRFKGDKNVLITSNCRLNVKLQDDAEAWRRRMVVVNFKSVKPETIIPNFAQVLVREEGPGILNWMLEGLLMLHRDIEEIGSIRMTQRQIDAVSSLVAESDGLKLFLKERVKICPSDILTVSKIVSAYSDYCHEHGWTPMSEVNIAKQLQTHMMDMFQSLKSNSCKDENDREVRGYRGVSFI